MYHVILAGGSGSRFWPKSREDSPKQLLKILGDKTMIRLTYNRLCKISDPDKKIIESGISDLRNALKGTNTEEVKNKTQALVQSSMKLGEAVYKSQQKDTGKKDTQQSQNSENKDKNKDNIVDADFEEVKEDKKENKKEDKEKSA